MSLADALKKETIKPGTTCTVATLIDRLGPDDQKVFLTAIADRAVSLAGIARALTKIGERISADTLGRHRRRECACD